MAVTVADSTPSAVKWADVHGAAEAEQCRGGEHVVVGGDGERIRGDGQDGIAAVGEHVLDVQAPPGLTEWQPAARRSRVCAGQDVDSGGQYRAGRGDPFSEGEADVDTDVAEYMRMVRSPCRGLRHADPVQRAGAATQSDQASACPRALVVRHQPGCVKGTQPPGPYSLGGGEDEQRRLVDAQGHGGDQPAGPLRGPRVQRLFVGLVVAAEPAERGVGQPG